MKVSYILVLSLAVAIIATSYNFGGSSNQKDTIHCKQLITQITGDESLPPHQRIHLLMEIRQLIIEDKVDPRAINMPPSKFNQLLKLMEVKVKLEKIDEGIQKVEEGIRKLEEKIENEEKQKLLMTT